MGFEDPILSLRGERLLLPVLLFAFNVDSAFFQLKLKTQTRVSRVSRTIFFAAPINKLDYIALTCPTG